METAKNGLIFIISILLLGCANEQGDENEVPNITGKLINSDSLNVRKIAKGKFSVVNVWAIFCGPCMEELPILEKVYRKYKNNKDFMFITLAMDSEKELLRFISSKDSTDLYRKMFIYSKIDSFSLPTLACLPHGFSRYYAGYAIVQDSTELRVIQKIVKSELVPITLMYNSAGKLVFKKIGSFDSDQPLTRTIDSLLSKQ